MRVVQRNLVYVTNLAMSIAKEDILKSASYFGQYGKILKVVVNKNTVYQSPQGPSVSCYITYHRADEALLAIVSVDGATLQGRIVRASFGTTKYCQHFLKVYNGPLTGLPPGQTLQSSGLLNSGAVVRVTCPNPECMYLHELGPLQDSFTKEDMAMGKHLASLDPVIQHILQQAKEAPLTVSGSYKSALPPARQDLLQPLYEQMAAERAKEERSALSSSSEHVTATPNSAASALKTPAKNVWKTLPPTTPVSIASTISEKSAKPLSASMTVKPVSKPEPVLSTSPKLSSSVALTPSPSLSSSAALNTSEWPDLLKASAVNGKDGEQPASEEEEVERVVEPASKKKKGAKHHTTSSAASTSSSAPSSASTSELSASQSALPATARWAKKQKHELTASSDSVPASPATTSTTKKHVIVVEQTESATKSSETADDSWPSLAASGTAPSKEKEERRESRGKNKKRRDESETPANNSTANNSAAAANNSPTQATPAAPTKPESDSKKSATNGAANNSAESERKTEASANNRTTSDSTVKTTPTAVPPKPRTVIDLDAVPAASDSDASKHSATTESVDQLQWISAHVSDLVLSDKDTVPLAATNTAPVAPPPGTHTPGALSSLFPFASNSVWTPLKGEAPTALSSLEASLAAQPTPAQTSPRQRSRFQFANQNSAAGTNEAKNSSSVPVTSHLFNEEDLRNTFKALLPNVNISFDSNNSFKGPEDSTGTTPAVNTAAAVNINSLTDFPSLKNTALPPHTQPPQSQLMAQLFAAHPMGHSAPFNNAPFGANNSSKMYGTSENQLNELNHTLNSLMFPAQSTPPPYTAPKQGSGTWPANTSGGVALDSNNPLQALLGMNDSIWQGKQSHAAPSQGPPPTSSAANNSNNTSAGLFYQQLQQLQQLQQMQHQQQQQTPQQPYFSTFQQPLVTQNLFLINQISQPGPQQWPQQQTQFRAAPNNSNTAPSPWGATTPLSYPQQHAINNFPPNGMPHGFNL